MSTRTFPRFAGVAFVFLVCLASSPSAELWYEHYDRALRAIERSQWQEAIVALDAAIEEKDESSARARTYGMRFIAYMPYFYAGVAQYNLGNVDAARRYFELEQRQGEIGRVERLNEQMQVLLAASTGPAASADAVAAADAGQARELDARLARARDLLDAGDHEAALAEYGAVLALDPDNAAALEGQTRARTEATAEMLAEITSVSPGLATAAPVGAVPPAAVPAAVAVAPITTPVPAVTTTRETPQMTEAGILEARAWELLRRGRLQLDGGEYEAARATFDVALLLAQDLPGAGQLVEEATSYRDIADAEIRRVSEARRQAELAAQTQAAAEPPRVAIVTPVNVDEPMEAEIVRLQGVVMDNNGVANLEIEVNGRRYDRVQTGTRGIEAVVRPNGGQATQLANQGTVVNFYHDVYLTEDVNQVVVRARNVSGQVTEERLEIRLNAERPQVFAAVIGIGDYQHPNVPDLQYTVADAEAFYQYLVDLGIPRENIIKLIDEQATNPAIRTALGNDLRRRAGADDMVIIYFAGHGGPEVDAQNLDGDGLEKYMLSWEADPENLYGTAFSMNEIANVFARLQANRVIFIADACYSGASGGRTVLSGRRSTISDSFLDRLGSSGTGRVIMSASSANEPSQERSDLGHGVFTYYLLEGLRGPADANRDGAITFDEAYDYVARTVPEATGQTQHPVKKGEVEGDLILGRVAL